MSKEDDKRCSHCHLSKKKVFHFNRAASNKDGFRSYCKMCESERSKRNYQKRKHNRKAKNGRADRDHYESSTNSNTGGCWMNGHDEIYL